MENKKEQKKQEILEDGGEALEEAVDEGELNYDPGLVQ